MFRRSLGQRQQDVTLAEQPTSRCAIAVAALIIAPAVGEVGPEMPLAWSHLTLDLRPAGMAVRYGL